MNTVNIIEKMTDEQKRELVSLYNFEMTQVFEKFCWLAQQKGLNEYESYELWDNLSLLID